MKKIVFFHPSSELYGADKILIYVMKNYADYDRVLILRSYGPLIDLVKDELPDVNIKIIPEMPIIAKANLKLTGIVNFLKSILHFNTLLKTIKNEKPEIVYLNTLAVLPVLFYFSSSVKKIIHVHEILKNNNLLHTLINKIALVKADLLICVSNAVKLNLENAYRNKVNKLKIVNNGISFSKNNVLNSDLSVDNTKINFALIGRIKPSHKGQNLLIDAVKNLDLKVLDKAHFYLVGSPVESQTYMLDEVKGRISNYNLSSKISIIPFVKEISTIYKQIDVVVVPSTFDDPFPTTVLEGMYFEKPVIGTAVGGIPEMIEDLKTGFVVKRDCEIDLSNKLKYFIETPSLIKTMGHKAKERFNKNYSESSFNHRYSNIINEFLLNKG
jgi:glycosyltransferase involved in cell wall biosynthesis